MRLIPRKRAVWRSGQGLVEYAMLLGFVIAFIMAVRGFFTTNLSGMVTDQVNSLRTNVAGAQSIPISRYAATTTANQSSDYTATQRGTGEESSSALSNAVQNVVQTY